MNRKIVAQYSLLVASHITAAAIMVQPLSLRDYHCAIMLDVRELRLFYSSQPITGPPGSAWGDN